VYDGEIMGDKETQRKRLRDKERETQTNA